VIEVQLESDVRPATPAKMSAPPDMGSSNTLRSAPEPRRSPLAPERNRPQWSNELQLPDDATESEVQGQYAIGLGILLLFGLLSVGTLYGLLVVLLKNTWGEDTHFGGRPQH